MSERIKSNERPEYVATIEMRRGLSGVDKKDIFYIILVLNKNLLNERVVNVAIDNVRVVKGDGNDVELEFSTGALENDKEVKHGVFKATFKIQGECLVHFGDNEDLAGMLLVGR